MAITSRGLGLIDVNHKRNLDVVEQDDDVPLLVTYSEDDLGFLEVGETGLLQSPRRPTGRCQPFQVSIPTPWVNAFSGYGSTIEGVLSWE